MSSNKNTERVYINSYANWMKISIAIFFGLLSFFLSKFNFKIDLEVINVNFPWILILPLVIAISYGKNYGLLSGISGAAFYPFYLWPQEGIANVPTAILLLILFYVTGILFHNRKKDESLTLIYRFAIIFIIAFILYTITYLGLYNQLMQFNSKFFDTPTISQFSYSILKTLMIKDAINFLFLLITAELFTKLPYVRKILGQTVFPEMRANHFIFILTIAISIIIWGAFYLLDQLLIKSISQEEKQYTILALIIQVFIGILTSRILIKVFEKRIIAENTLANNEEKFRMITDNSTDIIALHNSEGVIKYLSPAAKISLGIDEEAYIGKNISLLLHNDDYKEYKNIIPLILENKQTETLTHRVRRSDNSYIIAESNCKLYESVNYEQQLIQIISRDVTEKFEANKEIEENEKILERTFDLAPFLILLVDHQGKIIKHNEHTLISNKIKADKTIYTLFNIHSNDEKPISIESIYHDALKNNVTSQKKEVTVRLYIKGKPTDYTLLVSTSILYKKKKKLVLIIIDNITTRKNIEKELRIAKNKAEESDRLKSAFLANMSHEIRTPMNGIIGFARLLQSKELSKEKTEKYSDIIIQNSNRLMVLVNDILDISKIESGKLNFVYKTIKVHSLINDLISFFTPTIESKNVELSHQFSEADEFTLKADDARLRQVFINLINNAIKFTEEGVITLGYTKNNSLVEFYVKDTGIGIPEEEKENIFKRFRQIEFEYAKIKGGTGLGLSISKKIVDHWGGKLWVESELNAGSTFYFTVPISPKE